MKEIQLPMPGFEKLVSEPEIPRVGNNTVWEYYDKFFSFDEMIFDSKFITNNHDLVLFKIIEDKDYYCKIARILAIKLNKKFHIKGKQLLIEKLMGRGDEVSLSFVDIRKERNFFELRWCEEPGLVDDKANYGDDVGIFLGLQELPDSIYRNIVVKKAPVGKAFKFA